MPWRERVNGVISRTTGYELRRSELGRPAPAVRSKVAGVQTSTPLATTSQKPPTAGGERAAVSAQVSAPIAQQDAKAATQTPPAISDPASTTPPAKEAVAPAAAKIDLPRDFDDAAKATIRDVKPWTMTSPEKLNALVLAVRYVVAHGIQGAVVECGVWRGGSMQAAARTLVEVGDTSRDLYLFDTFEGMSEPGEKDLRHDGVSASDLLERNSKGSLVWAVASLADVQDGMRRVGYPDDRLHYVQGKVEDTVPQSAPESISILRLDTDWYESTKHELDHLYPRLASGGVLLLDDYGWWDGAKRAVDEWLEESGERLLLLRMGGGRVAVKP